MDCTDLKFDDGIFDAVVSQDTIEHVQDDRKFLSEIKRVLKDNGTCIMFTPNSPQHNQKPENIYHLREYSKDSFYELLSNHFCDITFYGKKLSKDLVKLESDLDRVRRYGPCGIRKIIPTKIRHIIGNIILKSKGNKRLENITCQEIEYFLVQKAR